MEFKFILSDLDGVIRKFPVERDSEIEKKYALPAGMLFKTAFEKTNLDKAVCGIISDEEWRQSIEINLAKVMDSKTAKRAIDEWSDFSGTVDHEYLDYIASRFANVPVVVLTNGTTRLQKDLSKIGIENRFFRIFNSADVGFCKPDKRIFDHILNELSCRASEILFIDDSLPHIKTAEELGFRVHHYKSLDILKQEVLRGNF